MTTNQSAKAKLFATYWGQKVLRVSEGAILSQIIDGYFIDRYKETGYLQLRSIADLTDEELCVIAKHSAYRLDEKNIHTIGRVMAKHLMELNRWSGNTILTLTDYLRSIGVALPFTVLEDGKPVTYSVERQVELKWIKINQPK